MQFAYSMSWDLPVTDAVAALPEEPHAAIDTAHAATASATCHGARRTRPVLRANLQFMFGCLLYAAGRRLVCTSGPVTRG
jgi:hypothetical protein